MKRSKQLILVLLILAGLSVGNRLYAQDQVVTGTIISSVDGNPVSDVKIRVKGEKEVGGVSDTEGNFSIKLGENTSGELVFVHPDYDVLELYTNGRKTFNVTLESNVRYNAYGQQVNRVTLNSEGRNGVLVFESKDQNFKTWFDFRVNFDGAYFFDKNALNDLGNSGQQTLPKTTSL